MENRFSEFIEPRKPQPSGENNRPSDVAPKRVSHPAEKMILRNSHIPRTCRESSVNLEEGAREFLQVAVGVSPQNPE